MSIFTPQGKFGKTPTFMQPSLKTKAQKAPTDKPIKYGGKGTRARLNTAATKMFFGRQASSSAGTGKGM